MTKVLIIACREYIAAVKTKSFVIGVILMPVLMFAGVVVQRMSERIADTSTYKVAVIDRSPDQKLAASLTAAVEERNKNDIFEKETQKQIKPKFEIQTIPLPADEASLNQLRLGLSDRVRKKELLAYVEIGPDVVDPKMRLDRMAQQAQMANASLMRQLEFFEQGGMFEEDSLIKYTTNRPTYQEFKGFIRTTVARTVTATRLQTLNVNPAVLTKLVPPSVVDRGLAEKAADGTVSFEAGSAGTVRNVAVPIGMLFLMFITVITGASPLSMNIIEEKQLRIAEILLSGVSPFQLMLGKLIGGVGTALTLALIYIIGAGVGAYQLGLLEYIDATLIGWFIVFTVVATFMYGALFIAAGAAVTNVKEAQALITPVMLFIAIPAFVFMQVVQYPSGMLAKSLSYFPLTSPMISMMRLSIPPGVPTWELAMIVAICLLATLGIVWMAGRIFRVGMLMHSKPASMGEALRWIVKA
jgi:ABC-2 type transport system permease protein